MRKKWLIVLAVISLLGIVIASVSTSQHIRILKQGLEESSFCAVSEFVNCDLVNASSYSEFLKIPVAWWGVLFYFIVFIISTYAMFFPQKMKGPIVFLWFLTIGGVLYSIVLAYISFAIIQALCIECIIMYLVNVGLMVFIYLALDLRLKTMVAFIKNYVLTIFANKKDLLDFSPGLMKIVITFVVVFVSGYVFMHSVQSKAYPERYYVNVGNLTERHFENPKVSIEPPEDNLVWGDPKGLVEVVEISDFECPFCKKAAFRVKPNLQEFKGKIKYYFINYPLSDDCNPYVQANVHPFSCVAARAGICAGEGNKFWQLHDWMFLNQGKTTEKEILKKAKDLKFDPEEFQACMYSTKTTDRLKADVEKANSLNIEGVPSIFINKRFVKNWQNVDLLRNIVKEEIKTTAK